MMGKITALYAGLNAILMLVLALYVVRQRVRAKVGIGDGGDAGLARAVRAHGNNIEYVPIVLVLLLCLELGLWPVWLIHALGLALTIGRVAHGIGLNQSQGTSPGRALGMTLTWGTLLIAALLNIWRWIGG